MSGSLLSKGNSTTREGQGHGLCLQHVLSLKTGRVHHRVGALQRGNARFSLAFFFNL